MILYREFGGKLAVQAMTWSEAKLALQLLAEERVGAKVRSQLAREDAAADAIRRELT